MLTAAVFVSAFLLFEVQPLMARAILPWFGGAANTWTTCQLFFQVCLLLGYLYAHASVRYLSPRAGMRLHLGLLAGCCCLLPITPNPHWQPTGNENPILGIVGLLTCTVGLPYLVLSSTSPLLQAWYARRTQGAPYRLFALSNLGSLLALISYPLVVEPQLTGHLQIAAWSGLFVLFALLAGYTAFGWSSLPHSDDETHAQNSTPVEGTPRTPMDVEGNPQTPMDHSAMKGSPSVADRLLWLLLAACPSLLVLAITNHLSQDVAAIPMFWVLTLGIYLVTFIICFDSDRWYRRRIFFPLMVLSQAALIYALGDEYRNLTSEITDLLHKTGLGWTYKEHFNNLQTTVALFCGGLFVACMVCHGELARRRPAPAWLTGFYLTTSVGGALGGFFVAVCAPLLFQSAVELQIGVGSCGLLAALALGREVWRTEVERPALKRVVWVGGLLGALASLGLLASQVQHRNSQYQILRRNFYGCLRVAEIGHGAEATRTLKHGIIMHGMQYVEAPHCREPITYYSRNSGVGLAITQGREAHRPLKLGAIGLGTGTLAAYGQAGDQLCFYEINPLVPELARNPFRYLPDCAAEVRVLLGDARLTLDRQLPQGYDILVVDAFSSDAIPVHLLTREAFAIYARHLAPKGILAVHISNKYLNLEGVVAQAARERGWTGVVVDNLDDFTTCISASTWVLLSSNPALGLGRQLAEVARPVRLQQGLRPWTDDFSNLRQILK